MWLGINHVIRANHMISLIISSTTDPRCFMHYQLLSQAYIVYPISYGCLLRRPRYIDRFSEVHLFLNEANNTAAYRSLSPQNVMMRTSWDRHPVVNKSDIYSWSPCKGREFHSIYFSIMTMRQCDSVAKAFSLMSVSFYIEPYLLIFLKTICASSWQRKSAKI